MTRIALFSLIVTCTTAFASLAAASTLAEPAAADPVDCAGLAQSANDTPAPKATPKEADDAAPTGKGADAKGQKSTASASKTKAPKASDEPSAEELEALKALGYVE